MNNNFNMIFGFASLVAAIALAIYIYHIAMPVIQQVSAVLP